MFYLKKNVILTYRRLLCRTIQHRRYYYDKCTLGPPWPCPKANHDCHLLLAVQQWAMSHLEIKKIF